MSISRERDTALKTNASALILRWRAPTRIETIRNNLWEGKVLCFGGTNTPLKIARITAD